MISLSDSRECGELVAKGYLAEYFVDVENLQEQERKEMKRCTARELQHRTINSRMRILNVTSTLIVIDGCLTGDVARVGVVGR